MWWKPSGWRGWRRNWGRKWDRGAGSYPAAVSQTAFCNAPGAEAGGPGARRRARPCPTGGLKLFNELTGQDTSEVPTIGVLTLEIHIEDARSLKEKRHVVKGLKDRLRNRFNVAVA